MKSLRLLNLAILALTICMASCTGEDGTNGMDGADGTNGINGANGADGANGENGADGANGANGADGENGVGFDEATEYGAVTMELDGTRPDEVEFTDTASFKFLPTGDGEGPFIWELNSVAYQDNNAIIFNIGRLFGSPSTQDSPSVTWTIRITDIGEDTEFIDIAELKIENYVVIGDDNKYFKLSTTFDNLDEGSPEIAISDLAFDATTNNLTFSYTAEGSYIYGGGSEAPLNVSGTVDVILFEAIEDPEF